MLSMSNTLSRSMSITAMYAAKSFSSFWSHIPLRPADPIMGVVEDFKRDKNSRKVNLSAGTYKDDQGKPFILNCVKAAQKIMQDANIDHEYLPIDGLQSFVNNSLKLAYSPENKALNEGKILGVQGLSGTGSLRIGFEFLSMFYEGNRTVYIPDPTWPNHKNVIARAGLNIKQYRYYDYKKKTLNLSGMLHDLDRAPKASIIVLHVCAHNPTGMDPTENQWNDIYSIIKKRNHFPFFDMAYQGFASGDPVRDSFGLRRFANEGFRLALAQSYAKNFGLYGERVGCFSMLCDSKEEVNRLLSHVKFLARAQYSNPPKYGAHIVDIVLSNPDLKKEWHRELKIMSDRLAFMRKRIYEGLIAARLNKDNFDHIVKQIGMFAYTGLSKEQVQKLISKYHIYLTDDGRISISGLNTGNVDYVAKAFSDVMQNSN